MSIVVDMGFRSFLKAAVPRYVIPNRKHFSETVIPRMFSSLKCKIVDLLQNEPTLSFTVDIWTAKQTTKSYVGLTSHWITADFQRKMAVLHCHPFEGSHTAVNEAQIWKEMLANWNIPANKCHIVIIDNAAHMVHLFNDLKVIRVSCFAHNVHSSVKDGTLAQRAVTDARAVVRGLVWHFRHSSSLQTGCRKFKQRCSRVAHTQADTRRGYKMVVHLPDAVMDTGTTACYDGVCR
jgi:hypothetical protein